MGLAFNEHTCQYAGNDIDNPQHTSYKTTRTTRTTAAATASKKRDKYRFPCGANAKPPRYRSFYLYHFHTAMANRRGNPPLSMHIHCCTAVPAKIEARRVAVGTYEMLVPLSRRLENARALFHQASVHRSSLCHGLEERVMRLAQMHVEQTVGRKVPAASGATVAV